VPFFKSSRKYPFPVKAMDGPFVSLIGCMIPSNIEEFQDERV
jgi:hypothetical protein